VDQVPFGPIVLLVAWPAAALALAAILITRRNI